MIRITVKGFAKFMTSSMSRQRKILRDFKFPKPEGVAQARYYEPAKSAIRQYHARGNQASVLDKAAEDLARQGAVARSAPVATKIHRNLLAIGCYKKYFSERRFSVLSIPTLQFVRGNVRVTATPDLCAKEKGIRKLIKLELGSTTPKPELVRIITQVIFEASAGQIAISAKDVVFLDVIRGLASTGAKSRTRLKADIDAACKNIEDMWPNIK